VCGNRATNVSHRLQLERRNLIRLGAARLILEILKEQGIVTETAFGRAGIIQQHLGNPERVVPLVWLACAFKAAATAAAQAELGLLVGLRAGLTDGNEDRIEHDTPVSSALIRIISRPTRFPNSLLTLRVSGHICTVECVGLPSDLLGRDLLAECAMGFVAGALRALCGARWCPSGFRFSHGPPPDASRHAALLQAPISFGAGVTAMEFESASLDRADAAARSNNPRDVYELRLQRDLVAEVRAVIASWSAIDRPSAPSVASELGLTPRTLNRLLGRRGTSFIRMVEDARYESARRLLQDPAAPVLSVAWSLGYADASAFSRAFRRWSGMTPTEWRHEAGSEAS
jgi:AraC-like DNA-binding protein